jgi:hypothetical protein
VRVPPVLRRAAARGAALALVNVVALPALALAWRGEVGRWDLLFVLLLGLVAAPLEVIEAAARGRGRLVGAGAVLAVGLLAATGLLMAHAQTSYAFALARGSGVAQATRVEGEGVADVFRIWGEARAVLVSFAAPFAALALGRLAGLRPAPRAAAAIVLAFAAATAARRGFVGLPQVSWLVATPWLGSVVQSDLFLQPVVVSLALPAIDALVERRLGPGPAAPGETPET